MLRRYAFLAGVALGCAVTVHAQGASLGDDPKGWPDFFDGTQAGGPYAWVDGPTALKGDPTLAHAVQGGQQGSLKLYICHARMQDGVHIGKQYNRQCNVSWGGKEHVFTSGYQILVNTRPELGNYLPQHWTSPTRRPGHVGGAVGNRGLRICRASHAAGSVHPGKEWQGRCYYGYGGREFAASSYEILQLGFDKTAWKTGRPVSNVDRCWAEIDALYADLQRSTKPAKVLADAARLTCVRTGDVAVARLHLTQAADPQLVAALAKPSGDWLKFYLPPRPQPGLFAVEGAEGVLRAMLLADARILWQAAQASRDAAVREHNAKYAACREKYLKEQQGKPAPSSLIAIDPCGPVMGQVTQTELGNRYSNTPEGYANATIDLAKAYPDAAMGLRLRLFLKLREIALQQGRPPTADEAALLRTVETYVKNQYVGVAQDALNKYHAWKAAQEGKPPPGGQMMRLFYHGELPPDFQREAEYALASGIAAGVAAAGITAALASGIGAVTISLATGGAAAAAAVGATSAAVASATAAATAGAVAAYAAGPVTAIAAGLVTIGIAIDRAVKIFTEVDKKKLEEGLRRAQAANIRLAEKFRTREGTSEVVYFFSKMTAGSSQAPVRDAKVPPSQQCRACLYQHVNYGGESQCFTGVNGNIHAAGFGDETSSIRMETGACPNARLFVYRDIQYRGDMLQVAADLRAMPSGWNDKISAVAFGRDGVNPLARAAEGGCRVCFYQAHGFGGRYICNSEQNRQMTNLKIDGINDEISSIQFITDHCAPGTRMTAQVFEHSEFRGRSLTVHSNVPALGTNWNDRISSIKVSYAVPSATQWTELPGRALDIGAGGAFHCIGTDNHVFRMQNRAWGRLPVTARRIATDMKGRPWIVGLDGVVRFQDGDRWRTVAGETATDIAVGGDGTVWIVGTEKSGKGYEVHFLRNGQWHESPLRGGALRIDADGNGNAWVVAPGGGIFRQTPVGEWSRVKGPVAVDIGVGAGGAAFVTGTDGKIYALQKDGRWQAMPGAAAQVTVGAQDRPLVLTAGGGMWSWGGAEDARPVAALANDPAATVRD